MSRNRRNTVEFNRLRHSDKELIVAEYQRKTKQGLFSKVARDLGINRSTVMRAFWGESQPKNLLIIPAIEREISRLIDDQSTTAECRQCPLRPVCDRLAKKSKKQA